MVYMIHMQQLSGQVQLASWLEDLSCGLWPILWDVHLSDYLGWGASFNDIVSAAGGGEGELGTDMDLGGGDGEGGGLFSQLWDVFSDND